METDSTAQDAVRDKMQSYLASMEFSLKIEDFFPGKILYVRARLRVTESERIAEALYMVSVPIEGYDFHAIANGVFVFQLLFPLSNVEMGIFEDGSGFIRFPNRLLEKQEDIALVFCGDTFSKKWTGGNWGAHVTVEVLDPKAAQLL